MAQRPCAFCCAREAAARHRRAARTVDARRADPERARFRRGTRRDHRDRRSVRAGRNAARDRARGMAHSSRRAFLPVGGKRDVLRLALRELHRAAPAPVDVVAAAAGAPFGTVDVNVEGCTLCLACVSACPTGALLGRSGAPAAALHRRRLRAMRAVPGDLPREGHQPRAAARFPRRDRACARDQGRRAVLLHPLQQAVRRQSSIERVTAKLEGKHWMFQGFGAAARRHQDVRGLPRRRDDGREFRSVRRARAAEAAHHRGLFARAATQKEREGEAERASSSPSLRKSISASRILRRADALLRHLGAGRVLRGPHLEQLRDRLRRPHDVELLQRIGEIVARQRGDLAPEDARERRPRAIAFVGRRACGRRCTRG